MRRIILLAVAAGALISVSRGWPPATAAADGALRVQVTLSPEEPRCDGDSVRVVVRVTQDDGSPAAGAQVGIVMPDGVSTATIRSTGETGTSVSGETDRHGVLRALLTPAPGTRNSFLYVIGVIGGPSPQPAMGACPFSDDTTYTIAGTLFEDGNGDGAQGPRERTLDRRAISLVGRCTSFGCNVPPHTTRTDRHGAFGWTGLWQDAGAPMWDICVTDAQAADGWRVVSLNGAALAPATCAYLGPLAAGVNNETVGVARSR